jgi:hypothetical protein
MYFNDAFLTEKHKTAMSLTTAPTFTLIFLLAVICLVTCVKLVRMAYIFTLDPTQSIFLDFKNTAQRGAFLSMSVVVCIGFSALLLTIVQSVVISY